MAAIGLVIGLIGMTIGIVVGTVGRLIGLVFGHLGITLGLHPFLFPALLIALGIIWMLRGSNVAAPAQAQSGNPTPGPVKAASDK